MRHIAGDQSDWFLVSEAERVASPAASAKAGDRVLDLLKLKAPPGQLGTMQQPDYLVALHAATCGKQGPESGTDEAPICQMAFLVYDVQRKKVLMVQQLSVKPIIPPGRTFATAAAEVTGVGDRDDGRAAVSDECARVTGVDEDTLDTAPSLSDCLAELDRALGQIGAHPDTGGRTLRLVTDGQAPLRLLLHPEAASKRLPLPAYYCSFHDLRKEFVRAYGGSDEADAAAATLPGMLDFLGLESANLQREQQQQQGPDSQSDATYGIGHCLAMSRVIAYLLADGYLFLEPEIIKPEYCPAVVRQSDQIDPETVARARGLPWQAGDTDVAGFFSGLNVRPGGVALVLSRTGRRNGEALIRFDSQEQRDLALLRHRHHLGRRYIEVFRAAARDFLAVAAAQSPEAEAFLARLVAPGQQLVRMRGLPYAVTVDQVLEFFDKSGCPVHLGQRGLLFAQHSDGRATGDAFVLFDNAETAEQALVRGHRQHIGARYVELFKSTPAELNQVLGGYRKRPLPEASAAVLMTPAPLVGGVGPGPHLIRMRGMPAGATVADILGFLEQHAAGIAFQGVHQVLNHLGQPTGEAVIEMISDLAVQLTCEAKDGRQFRLAGCGGSGAVEVQRCLPSDVPGSPPPPPPPLLPPPKSQLMLPHGAQLLPFGHGHHQFPPGAALLALQSPFLAVPSVAPFFATCPQPTMAAAAAAFGVPQCADQGLLLATQAVMAI